jgi:hypothetical protein
MKRFVLSIVMFGFLTQLTGCGSDSSTPVDPANLPKDFESRREAEHDRKTPPKTP